MNTNRSNVSWDGDFGKAHSPFLLDVVVVIVLLGIAYAVCVGLGIITPTTLHAVWQFMVTPR